MATRRMLDAEILDELEELLGLARRFLSALDGPVDSDRRMAATNLHEFLHGRRQGIWYLLGALHDDLLRTVDLKVRRR
jgi:hypothetical protein